MKNDQDNGSSGPVAAPLLGSIEQPETASSNMSLDAILKTPDIENYLLTPEQLRKVSAFVRERLPLKPDADLRMVDLRTWNAANRLLIARGIGLDRLALAAERKKAITRFRRMLKQVDSQHAALARQERDIFTVAFLGGGLNSIHEQFAFEWGLIVFDERHPISGFSGEGQTLPSFLANMEQFRRRIAAAIEHLQGPTPQSIKRTENAFITEMSFIWSVFCEGSTAPMRREQDEWPFQDAVDGIGRIVDPAFKSSASLNRMWELWREKSTR
jgi:hypothetical protein